MTTIYDIAKAANSSTASVSRVMNGKAGVKPETAARIHKAMGDLNFQPRWRVMEQNRLVVLIPNYKRALESSYIARILSGITDTAFKMGYNIQLRPFNTKNCNPKHLRQMLIQEAAAGCLIISLNENYFPSADIDLTSLPHVIVGHKQKDNGINQIFIDDFKAGYDATKYLIDIGHQQIGIVSFSQIDIGHKARCNGFRKALQEAKLDTNESIELDDASIDAGRSAARHLFNLQKHPTALVITNEDLAIGFQLEAKTMGITVPNDISIVTFEESDLPSLLDTPMTAMRTPSYSMGIAATRTLEEQIENSKKDKQAGPIESLSESITIPLVVRKSTQKLKQIKI
ncbi:LacI family DNA-binding transcriptional regulator [Coraliomargarita sp. SDUM461004]|uniref:LacI family DNA-binding transcriptional regulator n=1 Tax=Thalassobacterium sedimentorum TaxID=3041258 RepID=A0ABU1AMZ7_9BACT|nr:LacI family DNA-binding transcriptional regulator [Coraliomargarita sp. SDUM461004]MDQ8196170.1 LacI family DNA-binding transcriptional regulator [Coraliomargarita sp. SDUM461004]